MIVASDRALIDGGLEPTGSIAKTGPTSSSATDPNSVTVYLNPNANSTGSVDKYALNSIVATITGGNLQLPSSTNVGSYTQSNAAPDNNVITISDLPFDPRNNAAFIALFKSTHNGKSPVASDFAAWRQSTIPPEPSTPPGEHQHYTYSPQRGWTLIWDRGYGPGGWGNALRGIDYYATGGATGPGGTSSGVSGSSAGTSGSGSNSGNSLMVALNASGVGTANLTDTAAASTDPNIVPAANGGTSSVQTSPSILSDITTIPQPEAAIPAPVYELDTPENLIIDASSFKSSLITENVYYNNSTTPTTLSSTVYSVDLKFDSVDGAVKYNYRISATI